MEVQHISSPKVGPMLEFQYNHAEEKHEQVDAFVVSTNFPAGDKGDLLKATVAFAKDVEQVSDPRHHNITEEDIAYAEDPRVAVVKASLTADETCELAHQENVAFIITQHPTDLEYIVAKTGVQAGNLEGLLKPLGGES